MLGVKKKKILSRQFYAEQCAMGKLVINLKAMLSCFIF